jgi:hypothetical protein
MDKPDASIVVQTIRFWAGMSRVLSPLSQTPTPNRSASSIAARSAV